MLSTRMARLLFLIDLRAAAIADEMIAIEVLGDLTIGETKQQAART